MSRRHLKKVFGSSSKSTEFVVHSDNEEYESDIDKPRNNSYAVLEIQSSESDSECAAAVTAASVIEPDIDEGKKKGKKKENKNRRKSNKSRSGLVDDIDHLVREVNAVLGEPSCTVIPDKEPKRNEFETIFSVNRKHLNFNNELIRFFGPEKKKHNQKKNAVKNQIAPYIDHFKAKGMSMSLNRTENGFTYYCYNHSCEYQKRHHELLQDIDETHFLLDSLLQTSLKNMHVEGILETFTLFCRGEDYSAANMALEQIISYLQFVAHPFFNITNIKTRLEYKIMENRPFHIAVLLYSHILSNKACHRTALELAKMLLNLDPSDPLDIMFIIDTFAIRAREYTWLIEAIDWLDTDLNVKYLFNIKFSYAMAHFHVANKNKEDLKTADDLIKKALKMYPVALTLLIPAATRKEERTQKILNHYMFNEQAVRDTCRPLYELIVLYAAFLDSRWKEPAVLEWLIRNAQELIELFDTDSQTKEDFAIQKLVRQSLFRTWPIQIYRHLCLIKPISNLLVEGAVPDIPLYHRVYFFNPAPESDSINRYNYKER